jgi:hypothetical protein
MPTMARTTWSALAEVSFLLIASLIVGLVFRHDECNTLVGLISLGVTCGAVVILLKRALRGGVARPLTVLLVSLVVVGSLWCSFVFQTLLWSGWSC